jgi:hypothetical protein
VRFANAENARKRSIRIASAAAEDELLADSWIFSDLRPAALAFSAPKQERGSLHGRMAR